MRIYLTPGTCCFRALFSFFSSRVFALCSSLVRSTLRPGRSSLLSGANVCVSQPRMEGTEESNPVIPEYECQRREERYSSSTHNQYIPGTRKPGTASSMRSFYSSTSSTASVRADSSFLRTCGCCCWMYCVLSRALDMYGYICTDAPPMDD